MIGVTTTLTETSAPPTGPDWRRTFLVPVRPDAWRAYLYFVLISVLAIVGIVFLFGVGIGSALLILTVIGIPLLALVVISGRAWNRLYRALARLAGAEIDAPPPFVRVPGPLHTVAAALTDSVGWRSLGFLALHSVVMTPVNFFVILGVVISASLIASPVVWLVMREPFITLGEPVDSLGAYLACSVLGVAALYLTGWVMLGLSRVHVMFVRALLGPTERERRVTQLEQARSGVVDDAASMLQRVERVCTTGRRPGSSRWRWRWLAPTNTSPRQEPRRRPEPWCRMHWQTRRTR